MMFELKENIAFPMSAVSTGLQDLPCTGDCLLAFSEEKLP